MKKSIVYAVAFSALVGFWLVGFLVPQGHSAGIPNSIEGVVTSSKGPEAGVWVIAETSDLPTKYTKIVVTDDRGRYALPELPGATYQVWVRGYGLVDSPHVMAKPGQHLDLKAVIAQDARAAAQIYPPTSWLSLVKDDDGPSRTLPNGQTRKAPFSAALAISTMNVSHDELKDFIHDEYPTESPARPSGVERNLVLTMWNWGTSTGVHTTSAAEEDNPTSNANGRMYGADTAGGLIVWLDPVKNEAGQIEARSIKPVTGAVGPRSPMLDKQRRVWYAAKFTEDEASFCKANSENKFARYFPIIATSARQIAMYDPRDQETTPFYTCFSADHNQIDSKGRIFFAPGAGKDYGALGWIDPEVFDKTHSVEAAQAWVPVVLDTNGDGKITKPWTEPNEPVDSTKDHRINIPCNTVNVSQADGSLWCAMLTDTPMIVRVELGPNPPESAKGEVYAPPAANPPLAAGSGIAVDSEGVVWVNWRGRQSTAYDLSSFDRRKCKVLSGPSIATGQQCPEGWTLYRKKGLTFRGSTMLADEDYFMNVDRHNALGLGKDVPIVYPTQSNALFAFLPNTKQWVTLNVPYPYSFMTRELQGRIDDPKAGWKGRGLWASYASRTTDIEGGRSRAVKLQIRPDPLAR
jgi:hypothetical protein